MKQRIICSMNRSLQILGLTLLLVMMAAFTAMGQSDPDFILSDNLIDFDGVTVGGSMSQSVVVTNAGTTNILSITDVTTITGYSITPNPPVAYPITVAPGASQAFDVTFTPPSAGTYTGNITFTHNAAGGTTNLAVTGNGQSLGPDFVLNNSSISFGDITVGGSTTQSITVTNIGIMNELSIASATSISGYSITPNPPAAYPITVAPGASQTFDVKFTPPSAGTFSGNIVFTHNAAGGTTNLAVSGTGLSADPAFILNNSSLSYGNVTVGGNITQSVTVTNTGVVNTLSITSATSITAYTITPNPPSAYPITVAPGASRSFNVTFTPTSAGTFAGNIVFTHNAPSGTTNLTVTGDGQLPDPAFILNNSILNFGNVLVGANSTQSITVTNTGVTNTLSITSATTISGYSITPNPPAAYPITISPGASRTFDVTFTPPSAGSYAGNIIFTHNAFGGTTNLAVSGSAQSPGPDFVLNNSSLSFGNVTVGGSTTQSVTVTNTGVVNALSITSATSISGYSITPNPPSAYPITVVPGASQTFDITFTPPSVSAFAGNIVFTHNAVGGTTNLAVSGNGQSLGPDFVLNTSSLSYDNVLVGASSTQSVTVTNIGVTNALSITSATTIAGYSITPNPPAAYPITVAPGASRVFNVTFTPPSAGAFAGNIVFSHNAAGGTTNLAVSGNGQSLGPDFVLNTSSLNFGTVAVGGSTTQSVTVTNIGVTNALSIISVTSIAGYNVISNPPSAYPITVAPGASRTFNVTFIPPSVGVFAGNIVFTHNAVGGTTNLAVNGNSQTPGPEFILNNSSLSFDNVTVGGSITQSVIVTNTGITNTLSIAGTSSIAGYSVTPNPPTAYPITVAPGASRTFDVTFTPPSAGTFSGNIAFTHNAAGGTTNLAVNGNGQSPGPEFILNNSSLSFGNVTAGGSITQSVTVTNTGVTNTLSINGTATITGYSVAPNPPAVFPISVAPGTSQTFNVTFTPPSAGAFTGNIVFTHNAPGGTTNLAVSGNGQSLGPDFVLNSSSLNLGNVAMGSSTTQSVTVTNIGIANTLSINGATTISGYTITPNPPAAYPIAVAPGASRIFNVTFTPTTMSTFSGNIVFTHNAPGGTTNLAVTGNGQPPDPNFVLSDNVMDFGDITVGESGTGSVTVTNEGLLNVLSITSATSIAGYSITPNPAAAYPITVAPGTSRTFDVTFTPPSAGSFAGNIVFTHNAFGGTTNLAVSGNGQSPGPIFALNNSSLTFGIVTVGGSTTQSVTVTNTGVINTLSISSATSIAGYTITPNPPAAYPITVAPGASQTFDVTFTPPSAGAFAGNIVFTHNAPGGTTNLALSGTGQSSGPDFVLNNSSLTFGNILVGASATQSITVTNTGVTNALSITSATSITGYTITPNPPAAYPITVAPGASRTFNVTFTPPSAGAFAGNIVFTHNAFGGTTNLTVSGNGQSLGPDFILNNSSLSFGNIIVGESATLSVTVTNIGTTNALSITGATSISGYSIIPTPPAAYPITVAPGASRTFNVTFTPPSIGAFAGNIVFTHNAVGGTTNLAVSGNGQPQGGTVQFSHSNVTVLDNTDTPTGFYSDTLRLINYAGHPLKKIQFKVVSRGKVRIMSVAKAGPFVSSGWVLKTEAHYGSLLEDGSGLDTINVVLTGISSTELVAPISTANIVTFNYNVVNITVNSDSTTLGLLNVSGLTSDSINAQLTADLDERVQIINRTLWGDINGDDYVNLLDLLNIVDHIIGKRYLSGEKLVRGNIAPWPKATPSPTPDSLNRLPNVNVLDLVQIQEIILKGQYPNGIPLIKSSPVPIASSIGLSKSTSDADAKLTFYISNTSIFIRVENSVDFKGLQVDLNNVTSTPTSIKSFFSESCTFLNGDTTLRVLIYENSTKVLAPGDHIIAEIQVAINDPNVVNVQNIVAANSENQPLSLTVEISHGAVDVAPMTKEMLPNHFALGQNYPNPFNPSTSINVSLPQSSQVRVMIYNLLGQEVRILFAGRMERGTTALHWDGKDQNGRALASGTYIYRMTAEKFVQSKKMQLIK